jgi:DNA-binding winged helix-turn-helix (wHTH) protein/predicted ATPase
LRYAVELDLENQCLWRGGDTVYLTRKAFAVLKILIEHRDRLVTKAEILRAAWPNARVEEAQVKQFIGQLRQLLRDDPHTPHFIETVHGRGYRFVGSIKVRASSMSARDVVNTSVSNASRIEALYDREDIELIGRERELATLRELFDHASAGERRTCLVCGEPGIGKTTLVDHFAAQIASSEAIWHLRAKCLRHYHAVEPFLAIGNALEDALRNHPKSTLHEHVQRYAPSWCHWLADGRAGNGRANEHPRLAEPAVREFGQLIDALAAERTVVLCLDDVHWADEATLSLLSYLSSGERPARLLTIAICPAQEMLTDRDACFELAVQLRGHDRCEKLVVAPLTEAAVGQYLARHWPQQESLTAALHRETEGHPLFVVRSVDHLRRQDPGRDALTLRSVSEDGFPIPDSLRELIEHEINRLEPLDQKLLETASVVGLAFCAAQVAAGMGMKVETAEQRCEALARHKRLLRRSGTAHWPDGTASARYEFLHRFAMRVLRDRVVPHRLQRLHRMLGRRLETAYARCPDEVAGELAQRFEAGADLPRALRYLQVVGMEALTQRTSTQAADAFRKALAVLARVPESRERDRHEIDLHLNLALAFQRSRGLGDADVLAAYTRARLLYDSQPGGPQNPIAAWRLAYFHFLRGELSQAHNIAEAALAELGHAQLWPHRAMRAALASCTFHLAHFDISLQHAASGLEHSDLPGEFKLPAFAPYEPRIQCHIHHAISLWAVGYAGEANRQMVIARTLAKDLSHPNTQVLALYYSAKLHQLQRDVVEAKQFAAQAIATAQEHALTLPLASATLIYGWALAQQGHARQGLEQMRQGLRTLQAACAHIGHGWHAALLAETQAAHGDVEGALQTVEDGLAALLQTGDRVAEAELYRLKGKLLFERDASQDAEAMLQRAVDVARGVGAKSWELRATLSLAETLTARRQASRARELLRNVYAAMPEHCGTHDHRQARQLLA